MNTCMKIFTKRIAAFTLTTLLLNASNMNAQAENTPEAKKSRNITSNITTLGTINDVSGLNTVLGIPAAGTIASNIGNATSSTGSASIAAAIGTPKIGNAATTVALVLGDPGVSASNSSISGVLGDIQGATFDTATDSLHAISLAVGSIVTSGVATATQVNNLGTASDTSGLYSDLLNLGNSTGDISQVYTQFTSTQSDIADVQNTVDTISTAVVTDIPASLSTMQTDVTSILEDTGTTLPAQIAALGSSALATSAQAVDILQGSTASGTVITGADNAYTADTNDLTSVARALAAIEGTGFAPATDSLKIISDVVNLGATASALSTMQGDVTSILEDTAVIGTAVNTGGGAATIGGVLGNPNDAITGSDSISVALGGMAGATFDTATDSLHIISVNLGDPAVGTVAGNIGSPLVATAASTLALVLGDPTASTGAASMSAAIGNPSTATPSASASIAAALGAIEGTGFVADTNSLVNLATSTALGSPVGASISADIANVQSAVNAIQTTIGTPTISVSSDIASLGTVSDVSDLYNQLTSMQQTLALLVNIMIGDPIVACLNPALINLALTITVTSTDTNVDAIAYLVTYNSTLATALSNATIAATPGTQTRTNTDTAINSLVSANNAFSILANQWAIDGSRPSSAYSAAQIQNALDGLNSALVYLFNQQAGGA